MMTRIILTQAVFQTESSTKKQIDCFVSTTTKRHAVRQVIFFARSE
jgi:hypothetical protein